MFGLIMKIFTGLLPSIANASNCIRCISISNHKYMTQPTLNNLHPNEYSQ